MRNLPIPSPDADSPVVRLYSRWRELEQRINTPMSDDERDGIVCGELAALEKRLRAEPARDARDLAIKFYVLVEYYEGLLADEIDHLIVTGALPSAKVDVAPADDPLLELVQAYRRHHDAYNASNAPDGSDEEVAMHDAWRAPYDQLCTVPPNATTLEGVTEAIRLVADEEENCGNQPNLTIKVLRAALAFFDGGRAQV